jgi:hypothetical protein
MPAPLLTALMSESAEFTLIMASISRNLEKISRYISVPVSL